MDKTKIVFVAVLVFVVGAVIFSKTQESGGGANPAASSVAHDHDGDGSADHDDSAHETGASTPDTEVSGGVTKLKIEDLRRGTGQTAAAGDNLTMNYRGTLLSGEEFDASYGREPFQFQLGAGQVIQGWDQGIVGMKEGGKRKLTIPSDLGYGDSGSPPKIPGGATLVFEVELIKVAKSR